MQVHLLTEERGVIVEAVVARTHRYAETSGHTTRIGGLSATLPSPEDVPHFLNVAIGTGYNKKGLILKHGHGVSDLCKYHGISELGRCITPDTRRLTTLPA